MLWRRSFLTKIITASFYIQFLNLDFEHVILCRCLLGCMLCDERKVSAPLKRTITMNNISHNAYRTRDQLIKGLNQEKILICVRKVWTLINQSCFLYFGMKRIFVKIPKLLYIIFRGDVRADTVKLDPFMASEVLKQPSGWIYPRKPSKWNDPHESKSSVLP